MGQIGYLFNLIFTFPIFNGLVLLYHIFGDFGVSIIVLTLIIKLVLFPLTLQQLKSMKATQALQPKMAEIKKKYANNQQEQAVAMQALYKEYGVNPLAGCLPLLIQLPVLYGLFYALSDVFRTNTHTVAAINANLYPFVPHFTTYPDVYLNWFTFLGPNFHISLAIADPTHILPILAGLATFIQLRMSQPKTTTPAAANDPTAQSTKMMQYFMPLITVFFGWTFPAGLALYWTVSSVFQAVQQYFVTGFGALLITPNFSLSGSGSNASANGNVKLTKQRPLYGDKVVDSSIETVAATDDGQTENDDESDGPIGSQLRTPRSSTARRRSSNNSASARRRSSNNARKRNVSRS